MQKAWWSLIVVVEPMNVWMCDGQLSFELNATSLYITEKILNFFNSLCLTVCLFHLEIKI